MKQIVFISGKGGTGKSTLVASLSQIASNKMLADCDVDAPNLHILLNGKVMEEKDFYGAKEAIIDKDKCLSCGICRRTCRFGAISENFEIVPFHCEGCGACTLMCPADAIHLEDVKQVILMSQKQTEEPSLMHFWISVLKARENWLQKSEKTQGTI